MNLWGHSNSYYHINFATENSEWREKTQYPNQFSLKYGIPYKLQGKKQKKCPTLRFKIEYDRE